MIGIDVASILMTEIIEWDLRRFDLSSISNTPGS
jgi:hypothetical protein